MENAVDRMVVDGKAVRNALVAVFALVVGAAMPSFAADWTDATNGTYTALKAIKGNGDGQGYLVTDIVPNCTDIVMMKDSYQIVLFFALILSRSQIVLRIKKTALLGQLAAFSAEFLNTLVV